MSVTYVEGIMFLKSEYYEGRYGNGFSIHVEGQRTAYHEVVYYVK